MEATKKIKKSVLIRQRKEADKEARLKSTSVEASLKNIPTSPRKMRLVVDMIRGLPVNQALNILKFDSKIGSEKIEKLLLSAIANWQVKHEDDRIEDANLFIKTIFVDGGRVLKRLRPAPQGRGHRVRKRSNHLTLVLDTMPKTVQPTKQTDQQVKDNN